MKLKVIIISTLVIIIGIIIGIILYFNSGYKLNKDRKNDLLELGNFYYENYYYPSVGEDYIKDHDSIKIPLSTISNSKNIKNKINSKIFKKCDYNNTFVEIIPKSPYKVSDYQTKINLDC